MRAKLWVHPGPLDANVTDEDCEFRCWKQLRLRIREEGGKFTLTCTSAAAERVFSLVEAIFGTEQLSLLADQVQAGAMLRYNKPHSGLEATVE